MAGSDTKAVDGIELSARRLTTAKIDHAKLDMPHPSSTAWVPTPVGDFLSSATAFCACVVIYIISYAIALRGGDLNFIKSHLTTMGFYIMIAVVASSGQVKAQDGCLSTSRLTHLI